MNKNKRNKRIMKLVAVSLLCIIVLAPTAQAVTIRDMLQSFKEIIMRIFNIGSREKTSFDTIETDDNTDRGIPSPTTANSGGYYEWYDNFDNQQQIDDSLSENYIVEEGYVKMAETYPIWDNPEWTRMKPITLTSSKQLNQYAVKIVVDYESEMRSDYGDIRFKFEDDTYWLDYWIEEKNPENNNKYAIVWIKIPSLPQGKSTVYMFYGNENAEDQSDYWKIFDENSWVKTNAHDQRITNHMGSEGTWDPDVAFGSGKFLIAWEEGTKGIIPPNIVQQQIMGRFYNEEASSISSEIQITPKETPPYRNENPSVAYGNNKFFVAYEKYNRPYSGERDVYGRTITTSGSVSNQFAICSISGEDIQADPCVAYGANKFFVVWEDSRQGDENYNVYGKFFDSNGNQIGSEKTISSRPNSQLEPWVVFDDTNNHFMVVWEDCVDTSNGPYEIHARLFDTSGNTLGSELTIAEKSNKDCIFPCVSFCSLSERYLVTWVEADLSAEIWRGDAWGKILDENGNTKVNSFKIESGAYARTDIKPYLSSSFFVTYDGNGDIWGKLISSTGEMTPYTLQISDGESDPADWENIAVGNNKIFAVWEDLRVENMEEPDVYANVWSLMLASSSDVNVIIGDEKNLVLDAFITSIAIEPENLAEWHIFDAEKDGEITFEILDGESLDVLMSDISTGCNLESIKSSSIRLKAVFTRDTPSTSPWIDRWNVSYVGKDEESPVTSITNIDGTTGLNDWYISDGVTIWLRAEDFPKDTGSGIDTTYYTLNHGSSQVYNVNSGIQLGVSQSSNLMGEWNVRFWSVDKTGNVENKDKPENGLTIRIDADRPYVKIIEPVNEQEVEVPFWVRVDASDNSGTVDKVEFDISPFGERDGLPYVDDSPPYEWYCDVEQKKSSSDSSGGYVTALRAEGEYGIEDDIETTVSNPINTGVNVMLRAQVYDESGQTWIHEIWIHVANWESETTDDEDVARRESAPSTDDEDFARREAPSSTE